MKNLAHNTYQCLFHQHTEKDGISYFSEALEDLCPQIRVLNQFSKLSLIVAHNTCDNKINLVNTFPSRKNDFISLLSSNIYNGRVTLQQNLSSIQNFYSKLFAHILKISCINIWLGKKHESYKRMDHQWLQWVLPGEP